MLPWTLHIDHWGSYQPGILKTSRRRQKQCLTSTWSFKAPKTLILELKYTRHLTTAVNQLTKASELHKHTCGEAAVNSLLWQRTRAEREWGWDLVPSTRLPNIMTHRISTMVKHCTGHFPSTHYFKIFVLLNRVKPRSVPYNWDCYVIYLTSRLSKSYETAAHTYHLSLSSVH